MSVRTHIIGTAVAVAVFVVAVGMILLAAPWVSWAYTHYMDKVYCATHGPFEDHGWNDLDNTHNCPIAR